MPKPSSEYSLALTELQTSAPYALTLAASTMAFQAQQGFWSLIVASTVLGLLLSLQSLIDLRTRQLPHSLNLIIFILGLAASPHLTFIGLGNSLAAAALLFAAFLAMGMLAAKLAGKQALGGGDLYLVTAIAPWLGLGGIPPFFLIIAVLGLGMLALQRLRGITKSASYPFGPILAAAGWLAYLYQYLYWQCIASFTA